MRFWFLVPAAFVAVSASARAADDFLMRPSHDVEVLYHSSGMGRGPNAGADNTLTMHFSAARDRIRMDPSSGHGSMIIDRENSRMLILMADQHTYMERPVDPSMPMFRATNAGLVRTGTDTIAGLSCTVYENTSGEHKGQVCLTSDGVMLRARSADHHGELEAVKVTYIDQPASLFEPPSDFKKFDMPAMPNGMPPGMGGPPMGSRGAMPYGQQPR